MVKKAERGNMPTWTAAIFKQGLGIRGWGLDKTKNKLTTLGSRKETFRAPNAQHPTPYGFTLLELTIVLFIIGLLVAIVVPRLGNVGSARLETTAKRLAAVVRYLAGEAALQNRPYRLNYDLDKHSYWITTLVATQNNAEFQDDQSPLSRPVQLPPTITFADVQAPGVGRVRTGRVYTHFLPQGYADPTLIHLRDQSSRVVTILIPPLTGEARIYQGYIDGFVRR